MLVTVKTRLCGVGAMRSCRDMLDRCYPWLGDFEGLHMYGQTVPFAASRKTTGMTICCGAKRRAWVQGGDSESRPGLMQQD
jgi:hypothetical protein